VTYTATQVLAAVKRSGVQYTLCRGWDDKSIAAPGTFEPHYVIHHHTANSGATGNAPSLPWVLHDNFYPIRACHFLVGRDGHVFVVYAYGCYHAGKGGPGRWGNGPLVAQDTMNHYAYGIEVESKGTSTSVSVVDGITPAQFTATSSLSRELLAMMAATPENAINHRTWAPGRKDDTLYADALWQGLIRKKPITPPPAGRFSVPPYPATGQAAFTIGQHGPHVRAIQKGLRRVQAPSGMTAADVAGVKAFQRVRPWLWPADGKVGPSTYKALAKPVYW